MNQQITDTHYRIILFFTDGKLDHGTVFLYHNAMQSQRDRYPLIFLDTTIIMCIQKCHFRIFKQRVLLQIQSWRINMGTQNAHTLLHAACTDMIQSQSLFHIDGINFVTGL